MSSLFAIQIDTGTASTDTSIGLYSGKLRWVTGLPDYDGATTIPTDAPGNVWKNDMLIEPIGNIVREIDIEQSGDYASLDGFRFKARNNDALQNTLDGLGINLINKEVKVYAVISDTFYPCYTGLVRKNPWDELEFEFDCIGKFRKVHSQIPPNAVTKTLYPNAPDSSVGEVIPICIGKIPKTEILNVSGEAEIVACAEVDQEDVFACAATSYVTPDGDDPYLVMKTADKTFQAGELSGGSFYLQVIKGDTEQTVQIIDNDISASGETNIYLETPLEGATASTFTDLDYDYDDSAGGTKDAVWWFQIISLKLDFIVSDKVISAFGKNSSEFTALSTYDSTSNKYNSISDLISSIDATASNTLGRPKISLSSSGVTISGDITTYYRIKPLKIEYDQLLFTTTATLNEFETASNLTKLTDLDRTTSVRVTTVTDHIGIGLFVYLPDAEALQSFTEIYIGLDYDTGATPASIGNNDSASSLSYLLALDAYGRIYDESRAIAAIVFPPDGVGGSGATVSAGKLSGDQNLLPNSYYADGGDGNDESSKFGSVYDGSGAAITVKSQLKINSVVIDSVQEASAAKKLNLVLSVISDGTQPYDFYLKQIGFIGSKTINIIKDNVYAKVSGQQLSGSLAEKLSDVLEMLFTVYDGLSGSDYDLTDLATTRDTWVLSRRLDEQKSSFEYYKHLAAQTFIGLWAKRDGTIAAKAWRSDTTPSLTDNQTNIIKGSLRRLEPTEISRIYNDFKINFNWDPGSKKYTRSITVTKTDQSSFPTSYDDSGTATELTFTSLSWFSSDGGVHDFIITLDSDQGVEIGDYVSVFGNTDGYDFSYRQVYAVYDGGVTLYIRGTEAASLVEPSSSGTIHKHANSIPLWKTYVGGVDDYVLSKQLWDQAQVAYANVGAVQRLPKELSECPWFIDQDSYEAGTGNDDNNTALRYAEELVAWNTRPKDFVRYEIPLTATTITRELLDSVNFSDAKLTNGATRLGWITALEYNPRNWRIGVTLILNPENITECDTITETGSAADTITESGSQPDTITEGNC